LDKEARLGGAGAADHSQALRLWLRMLTCTQLIETRVRAGLRDRFRTTLPRFDLMAQLERVPEGLRMNELSRRMMVTGGNVTGIADQLESEGLVQRVTVPTDRRVFKIQLTARGRKLFTQMAREHETWVLQAFASLSSQDATTLHTLLGRVKAQCQGAPSSAAVLAVSPGLADDAADTKPEPL
jgi:DNA-binding MarR family transcriptional regulator